MVENLENKLKVDMYISGRQLSKSNVTCMIFIKKNLYDWVHVGNTETLDGTFNPDFTRGLTLPYTFERKQELKLQMVYDKDTDSE